MNSPTVIVDGQDDQCRQPIGIARVSHVAQCEEISTTAAPSLGTLTDVEREQHIASCAWLMEDAWRRYCETGCFSHRGEADRWRLLMEDAIKSRPAAYVAKLEAKRGLR